MVPIYNHAVIHVAIAARSVSCFIFKVAFNSFQDTQRSKSHLRGSVGTRSHPAIQPDREFSPSLPTFQSSGSYKYPGKHVSYVLIRFTCCVPKYQLPPTVAASGQSEHESVPLGRSRPVENYNAKNLSAKCQSDSQNSSFAPHFIFWRQLSVIRIPSRRRGVNACFLRLPASKELYTKGTRPCTLQSEHGR